MVKYDSQISILFFDFSLVFQAKVKIWGTFQPSILCPIKVGYCRFARFQQKYFTYFQAEKQIPFHGIGYLHRILCHNPTRYELMGIAREVRYLRYY